MKIYVGIATAGRREQLNTTLRMIAGQTRKPDRLIVCTAADEDCDEAALATLPFPAERVRGAKGISTQRNAIIDALDAAQILIFFDDDFYPAADYLAQLETLFADFPRIVAATGRVLADGALGRGIGHAEAVELLSAAQPPSPAELPREIYGAYGCNMAFRMAPLLENRVRFDENLPLYGWGEDVEFTRRCARFGDVVKSGRLQGVHLGTKRGRTSGVKFGYSQIANQVYFVRKGSIEPRRAIAQALRNLARNLQMAAFPEPWIDRRGRLRGNLLALADLLRGRIDPKRILDLP